jgi:hypothetical protein
MAHYSEEDFQEWWKVHGPVCPDVTPDKAREIAWKAWEAARKEYEEGYYFTAQKGED